MTRLTTLFFAALLALGSIHTVAAQTSDDASHEVTIDIEEMNAITVGSDVTITLDAVTAGQAPTPKSAESTYRLTTNSTDARKVTAAISGFDQEGITLKAELTAPGAGQSAGQKTLTDEPVNLVNDISQTAGTGSITYTAEATAQSDPGSYSQTVTYTVMGGQ